MKTVFQTKLGALVIAILIVASAAVGTRAQDSRLQLNVLDHLAPKASETVDVNIDGRLLSLAAKAFSDKDDDEREIKALITGIKGIYVKTFEFEADGQYTNADVEAIRSQLRGPNWTRVLNVNSKKEGGVEVYLQMNGDVINGLAVLSAEDRELVVVNIVGPVNLEKLAKIEGQFGVPDLGLQPDKPKTKP